MGRISQRNILLSFGNQQNKMPFKQQKKVFSVLWTKLTMCEAHLRTLGMILH